MTSKRLPFRVGTGFDVHAFAKDRPLVVGGVTIPFDRGLAGHSDADVLLHAIADAILGALALGDIGMHFPDTDAKWKGADSRVLLRHVAGLSRERGYAIGNVDATVIAQVPKLAPHVGAMRANLAADLALPARCRFREGDDDRAPGIHRSRGGHRRAGERPARGRGGGHALAVGPRIPIRPPARRAAASRARACRRLRVAAGRSCRRAAERCDPRSPAQGPHRLRRRPGRGPPRHA